ncbi:MAG: succinylglutamate desuccinylase/aspartoacylase family protein [Verrucomicrobiota bacterium]
MKNHFEPLLIPPMENNLPKQNSSLKRSVNHAVEPLERLAQTSARLLSKPLAGSANDGETSLPRYVYLGEKGGGDVIRLGLFATLHGDEPEGPPALAQFVAALEANPEIARGYAIFIYPICNPTGYADGTRFSRSGKDLNREFWINSIEPEVRLLETEIWTHAFDGIVSLHADDTSDGLYGFVNGAVFSENLLEPALRAAERFLPRNRAGEIDGFKARSGIIIEGYHGVLQAPEGLVRPPFEIVFETPQKTPVHLQIEAVSTALQTILVEYRQLMALAQNI